MILALVLGFVWLAMGFWAYLRDAFIAGLVCMAVANIWFAANMVVNALN